MAAVVAVVAVSVVVTCGGVTPAIAAVASVAIGTVAATKSQHPTIPKFALSPQKIYYQTTSKNAKKNILFGDTMYIKVKDIIYYFEKFIIPNNVIVNNYFCLDNYKIYSESEKIGLCYDYNCKEEAFIPIPYITAKDLKITFIKTILDKGLKRKLLLASERDFQSFEKAFHIGITDCGLKDDWNIFEDAELTKIAVEWCNINNIKYTLK